MRHQAPPGPSAVYPTDGRLSPSALRVAISGASTALHRRIEGALFENPPDAGLERAALPGVGEGRRPGCADVVVLALPGSTTRPGVTVGQTRAWSGDAPITAVLEDGAGRLIRGLLDAGVLGVVFASNIEEALVVTVRATCSGQIALPLHGRRHAELPAFTHRERQTLQMAINGRTNAQIASELYLAEGTVKCHLSAAFDKLGVRSRWDAAALLLDTPDAGGGFLPSSGAAGLATLGPGEQ